MRAGVEGRSKLILVIGGSALTVAIAIAVNLATGGEIPAAVEPVRPWLWHIVAALTVFSAICSVVLYDPEARKYLTFMDIIEAEQLQDNSFVEHREGMLGLVDLVVHDALAQYLGNSSILRLKLQDSPEAVGRSERSIGDSTVLETFDDGDGSLLILGGPGAGKTVLLAQLAAELLDRARERPDQPIPLLVPLAEWQGQSERWLYKFRSFAAFRRVGARKLDDHPADLGSWLVRHLHRRYRIKPPVGRRWIAQHRLVLLLDGLDEVSSDFRNKCVKQMDSVVTHENCPPVVITCRSVCYAELPRVIRLRRALTIAPLTRAQIQTSLSVEENGLRDAMRSDPALSELLVSPLLLHIARSVYRDLPDQATARRGDRGYRTHARLMDAYLNELLGRRGRTGEGGPTTTLRQLVQLARMTSGNNSAKIFDLRQIFRKCELPVAADFVSKSLLLGPMAATAIIVGVIFPTAMRIDLLSAILLAIPLFAVISVAAIFQYEKGLPPNPLRLRRGRRVVGAVVGMGIGVATGVVMNQLIGFPLSDTLMLSPTWSKIVVMLGSLALAGLAWFVSETRWRPLIFGVGVTLCVLLIAFPPPAEAVSISLSIGLPFGVFYVILSVAASDVSYDPDGGQHNRGGLLTGIVYGVGILAALTVAAVLGAPFVKTVPTFLFAFPVGLVLAYLPAVPLTVVLTLSVTPLARRLTFSWLGILPARLGPLLRELSRIGLVTRPAGRWQFTHSLLREHLATLDPYDSVHRDRLLEEDIPVSTRLVDAVGAASSEHLGLDNLVPGDFLVTRDDLLVNPDPHALALLDRAQSLGELFDLSRGRLLLVAHGDARQIRRIVGDMALSLLNGDRSRAPLMLDASTWTTQVKLPGKFDCEQPARSITAWAARGLVDACELDSAAALHLLISLRIPVLVYGFDELSFVRQMIFKASLNEFRYAYPEIPVALFCNVDEYTGTDQPLSGGVAVEVQTRRSSNPGYELLKAGDFIRAVEYYERNLANDGPRDAQSLSEWRNFAEALHFAGDLEQAERRYREALAAAVNRMPAESALLLDLHAGLGETLHMLGRLDEAESHHREAFNGFELYYGPRHPRTLGQRDRLATILYVQGKMVEYWTLLREGLDS